METMDSSEEAKRKRADLVPCSQSCTTQLRGRQSLFDINAVGDNLLLEILIRLPVKCANQYKCVSKLWNSLISHPDFARRFIHHRRLVRFSNDFPLPFTIMFDYANRICRWNLCITSDSEVFKSRGFSLSFLPCYEPKLRMPILIASYKDLLLCQTGMSSENVVYTICNPLTMQWVDLPLAPRQSERQSFRCGFLRDPTSEQVVIVRVPAFNSGLFFTASSKFKLQVFSSHTNTWRKLSVRRCPQGFSSCFTGGSCVARYPTLYWLCEKCIFAYDVFGNNNNQDDGCRFIDLPSAFKANVTRNCLGVCRGKLRLSQLLLSPNEYNKAPTLSVWELKEDDYNRSSGKWCLEHKIFLKELASETPKLVRLLEGEGDSSVVIMLDFHPHDADIVYLQLLVCVVTCNIRTKTLTLACNITPSPTIVFAAKRAYALELPWWPTPVPTLPQNVVLPS